MFVNNIFLLESFIESNECGSWGGGAFHALLSRSSPKRVFFKGPLGENLGFTKNRNPQRKQYLYVNYAQVIYGKKSSGMVRVDDPKISDRIVSYVMEHSKVHTTNCATFAQYLLTGNFLECDRGKRGFILSGGANVYTGQKIKAGDTLCVFYYGDRAGRRTSTDRGRYRSSSSMRNRTLGDLGWEENHYPLDDLSTLYRNGYDSGIFCDFHFLFCIGVVNGEPVFVQQMGIRLPHLGKMEDSGIVTSVGTVNISHHDIPAMVFIKRARRKISA